MCLSYKRTDKAYIYESHLSRSHMRDCSLERNSIKILLESNKSSGIERTSCCNLVYSVSAFVYEDELP